MAGYQDLFADPVAAMGYGLLTSRQNPLGEAAKLLQAAEQAKQQRKLEEEDREYKRELLRMKSMQPKLQFNPVTGEMFDMRTGAPYNAGGAYTEQTDSTLPPPPAGLNPKERAQWRKTQIENLTNPEIAAKRTAKEEGAARFEIALSDMEESLNALKERGNIVSTENDPLENLGLSISNSGLGRAIGGALGMERSTKFETAENIKPRIIAALAQATDQSARSLDSNTELKLALDSLGSPSASYETRMNAINTIRAMYANPDLLKTGEEQPAPQAGDSAGGGAIPQGWTVRVK